MYVLPERSFFVVCFCYHRCNSWGVTRVAMPFSNSTWSLVTPCVTFHVTPSPTHFVSSYPIVAGHRVMHAQYLPSLPCKKHHCAVGQLFLLRSSFWFSMPLVETTTVGVQMNMAKCNLEPSAPLAYFASASGIYKHRRAHNVPQGDKITSQRLLHQSQAGVYRGKRHIPPHFGLFGPIRVPLPQGVELLV